MITSDEDGRRAKARPPLITAPFSLIIELQFEEKDNYCKRSHNE